MPETGISAKIILQSETQPKDIRALRELVDEASTTLSGHPVADEQFRTVLDSYCDGVRAFHGFEHAWLMASLPEEEKAALKNISPDASRTLIPLTTLAGFYHDTVYAKLDGINPRIEGILSKYTVKNGEAYRLRDQVAESDREVFNIVRSIFASEPGAVLFAPNGPPPQNELLSALVASDHLHAQGHTAATIAQVSTMIAGTIPFRDEKYFKTLAERLHSVNQERRIGLSSEQIDHSVKAAVFLANKDVLNFAGRNATTELTRFQEFVKGTWKLIAEDNPSFCNRTYTAREFRVALQKQHDFVTGVLGTPDRAVFHRYEGYPNDEEFSRLKQHFKEEQKTLGIYLKAKISALALVEALAAQADIGNPSLPDLVTGSEKYLPKILPVIIRKKADVALEVLKDGREDHMVFDIGPSPIGAYLLNESRGEEKVSKVFTLAEKYLGDENHYPEFLQEAKRVLGHKLNIVADTLVNIAIHDANGMHTVGLKLARDSLNKKTMAIQKPKGHANAADAQRSAGNKEITK